MVLPSGCLKVKTWPMNCAGMAGLLVMQDVCGPRPRHDTEGTAGLVRDPERAVLEPAPALVPLPPGELRQRLHRPLPQPLDGSVMISRGATSIPARKDASPRPQPAFWARRSFT